MFCSSRFGTPNTSITCRSPWLRPSAWADGLQDVELAPDRHGLLRYAGVEPDSPAARFWQEQDRSPALQPVRWSQRRTVGPIDAPLAVIGTSFTAGENFVAYLRMQATLRRLGKGKR